MPSSSRNPFRTRVQPPSTSANPLSTQSVHPGISNLDAVSFDDDLPPPYTPGPTSNLGETTLDYNPHHTPHTFLPTQPPVLPASVQWRPPLPSAPTVHAALPPHSSSRSQTLGRHLAEAITSRMSHDPSRSSSPASRSGPSPSLRHHLAETIMTHISRELDRPPSHAHQGPPSVWRQLATQIVQTWEPQPQPHPSNPAYPSRSVAPPASDTRHGYPTRTPTPGHPLLKDGQLLVYPRGYTCSKCHGTGFKRGIPSRPCRRCWATYSKPFSDSGPLAAAFARSLSASPSSASSFTSPSFQRPLPALRSAR